MYIYVFVYIPLFSDLSVLRDTEKNGREADITTETER